MTGKGAVAVVAALFSVLAVADEEPAPIRYAEMKVERGNGRRPYEPPAWFVRRVPETPRYEYLDQLPTRWSEAFKPMGRQEGAGTRGGQASR